ncbi:twin-arginine translocation signal domain-containing protein [Nonomuraea sp. JJY05]|jgi:ABC-type maltose transport system permease subunit
MSSPLSRRDLLRLAAATAAVPVLFVLTQRYFVRGIALTGLK